ncbi:MAG: hypothetical protein R2710_17690 [Acidimicrobiales bacterium]
MRGIYPIIATITEDGYQRLDDDVLAQRFAAIVEISPTGRAMNMPFYGCAEQVEDDRADYAQKGIARWSQSGRHRVRQGILRAERRNLRKIGESTTASTCSPTSVARSDRLFAGCRATPIVRRVHLQPRRRRRGSLADQYAQSSTIFGP